MSGESKTDESNFLPEPLDQNEQHKQLEQHEPLDQNEKHEQRGQHHSINIADNMNEMPFKSNKQIYLFADSTRGSSNISLNSSPDQTHKNIQNIQPRTSHFDKKYSNEKYMLRNQVLINAAHQTELNAKTDMPPPLPMEPTASQSQTRQIETNTAFRNTRENFNNNNTRLPFLQASLRPLHRSISAMPFQGTRSAILNSTRSQSRALNRDVERNIALLQDHAVANAEIWNDEFESSFSEFKENCKAQANECQAQYVRNRRLDTSLKVFIVIFGIITVIASISQIDAEVRPIITGITGALSSGLGSLQAILKFGKRAEKSKFANFQLDKLARGIKFELLKPSCFRPSPWDYIIEIENQWEKILNELERNE